MTHRKILVVDNSEYTCSSFRGAFTSLGFKTISVSSGPDAIRLALFVSPDLIILDSLLEGLEGLKILNVLRQMNYTKNIPVIITSSSPDKDKIVAALKLGISGFLTKPIEMVPAIHKIKAVLEESGSREEFPPSDSNSSLNLEHFKSLKGNLEDLFKFLKGVFNLLITGFATENMDMILATLSKITAQQGEAKIDSVNIRLAEMKNAVVRRNWQAGLLELEALFFLFREMYVKLYPREK